MQAVEPIERTAAGMSDGDDHQLGESAQHDDGVRKPFQQMPANGVQAGILLQSRQQTGKLPNELQGCRQFGEELIAKAGTLIVVPGSGGDGFAVRFRQHAIIHGLTWARRSARA